MGSAARESHHSFCCSKRSHHDAPLVKERTGLATCLNLKCSCAQVLEGVLASMREWKHGQRPQPAPREESAALRLSPAQSAGSPRKGKRTDAAAPAAAAQSLDDTVDGFVYEVEMVFTRAGRYATICYRRHLGCILPKVPARSLWAGWGWSLATTTARQS